MSIKFGICDKKKFANSFNQSQVCTISDKWNFNIIYKHTKNTSTVCVRLHFVYSTKYRFPVMFVLNIQRSILILFIIYNAAKVLGDMQSKLIKMVKWINNDAVILHHSQRWVQRLCYAQLLFEIWSSRLHYWCAVLSYWHWHWRCFDYFYFHVHNKCSSHPRIFLWNINSVARAIANGCKFVKQVSLSIVDVSSVVCNHL